MDLDETLIHSVLGDNEANADMILTVPNSSLKSELYKVLTIIIIDFPLC